jgi:hypothetical protein
MSEFLKRIGVGLGPLFADLERRTAQTLDLTGRVRQALADEEKDHVISASYQDDTLVVVTDSAAWAARIHYAQERMLKVLQEAGETQARKVRVRVGARTE